MGDKGKNKGRIGSSKEEDKDAWKCKACKKIFADANSNILECERCSEHFCAKCCKVNDIEYTFMSTRKDIHWFCTSCDVVAMESVIFDKELETKINVYIKALNERIIELEKMIAEKVDKKEFDNRMEKFTNKNSESMINMKSEIQEIKHSNQIFQNNLVEKLKSFEIKMKQDIDEKINEDDTWAMVVSRSIDEKMLHVQSDMDDIKLSVNEAQSTMKHTKEFLQEEKDKENRRRNIIIYRMPESKAKDVVNKQKDDKEIFLKLMNDVLEVNCNENDIIRTFRFGKKEEGKDKPLLIEFKSMSLKNQMMESLYKLAKANDVFKNLSISHDMTKAERNEQKKLVNEAKDKEKNEGEFRFKVRGLPGAMRIVKIKKREEHYQI